MAQFIEFDSPQDLADMLANDVICQLESCVENAGKATLAVSGGSTPRTFFDALSRREFPWHKVVVTPVDERFVPPTHERSNAKLITDLLLQHHAATASFQGLFREGMTLQALEKELQTAICGVLPPSVCILGMGIDGHTASLFPDADRLKEALKLESGRSSVLTINAPGASEPRITQSLSTIIASDTLFLHIEGDEKRRILEDVIDDLDTGNFEKRPISAVLAARPDVQVYWTG